MSTPSFRSLPLRCAKTGQFFISRFMKIAPRGKYLFFKSEILTPSEVSEAPIEETFDIQEFNFEMWSCPCCGFDKVQEGNYLINCLKCHLFICGGDLHDFKDRKYFVCPCGGDGFLQGQFKVIHGTEVVANVGTTTPPHNTTSSTRAPHQHNTNAFPGPNTGLVRRS